MQPVSVTGDGFTFKEGDKLFYDGEKVKVLDIQDDTGQGYRMVKVSKVYGSVFSYSLLKDPNNPSIYS
jgi:hypothetical protein